MKKILAAVAVVLLAGPVFAVVPSTELYVTALGHFTGAANAQWRGDVWIFNPSAQSTATVDIYFLLRQANPSPDSRRITLAPGETRYLPDIILNTFGINTTQSQVGSGGLRIVSTIPVVVTARSFVANVYIQNVANPGSSGQFYPGIPGNLAVGVGASTDIIGLDQDANTTSGQWRSHLGFIETTGSPVDVQMVAYDTSGNPIGSPFSFTLQGYEVKQINYVITTITGGYYGNVRVRCSAVGQNGRFLVTGTRADNITSDPSTVDPVTQGAVFGKFEGVVLDPTNTRIDGGVRLVVGTGALTDFAGTAGIPCGADSYVLDFSIPASTTVTFSSGFTFNTSFSLPYSDGVNTIFTTNWTFAGSRGQDGTWTGTLGSTTTGGAGDYASCNNPLTPVNRNWRAGWTGNS